jgi:hypothetical protein
MPSPDQVANGAGGNQRQQSSAFRRCFPPHDDAPRSSLGFISFQRKLNLWLTMGILPASFFAPTGMADDFFVHRGPFEHRDKKGPAICRAFSNPDLFEAKCRA